MAQAEQLTERQRQMVSDIQARIERVQQKAADARASGDDEIAEKRMREQADYKSLLRSVRQTLEQAEETVAAVREAFARAEAQMAREAALLAEGES